MNTTCIYDTFCIAYQFLQYKHFEMAETNKRTHHDWGMITGNKLSNKSTTRIEGNLETKLLEKKKILHTK